MNEGKRKQAYLMFAISGIVVISIFVANVVLGNREKPNTQGCYKDSDRSTVILVDRTDGLASQTQAEIIQRVQTIVEDDSQVFIGERVSVFTLDALSRRNLQPTFEYCKPPATGSELTQDPRAIAKRKKVNFDQPLEKSLRVNVGAGDQSPIAEALSDLSKTEYFRAEGGARLLVYSDLLQHTKDASVYNCSSADQLIKSYTSSRVGSVRRPAFNNLEVVLNVVPREGLSITSVACRDKFWNWFFGDNTGSRASVTIDYLPG